MLHSVDNVSEFIDRKCTDQCKQNCKWNGPSQNTAYKYGYEYHSCDGSLKKIAFHGSKVLMFIIKNTFVIQ